MWGENMHYLVVLIVVHVTTTMHIVSAGNQLNEYISHYEPLDYDSSYISAQQKRNKRSSDLSKASVHVQFRSHEKLFRLKLRRDTSTFGRDLQIVSQKNIPLNIDIFHFYHGFLLDEPESQVYGSIFGGIFDGNIHTKDGVFYVEKISKYPTQFKNISGKIHSIIYHSENVIDPFENHHPGHVRGCGVTEDDLHLIKPLKKRGHQIEDVEESSPRWHKYTKRTNRIDQFDRIKRKINRNEPTTCTLSIQTDPSMWEHFYSKQEPGVERRFRTQSEITTMIAQHIQAINVIYKDTLFNSQYPDRRFHFEVQRIQIDDDDTCKKGYLGERNKFCENNVDARNFLALHSADNHEQFCLSYVFTYRDFPDGVLGLAWVGSPDTDLGICARNVVFEAEDDSGTSVKLSLNTGIISFVNYHSIVPPVVSQLTLAHEIGHNFGSVHDPEGECSPGDGEGNYLMFPSATSGSKSNNFLFSNCSIRDISRVLDGIFDKHQRRNCFVEKQSSYCGNKIIENHEECDCGHTDEDCAEKCCYPRVISEDDKRINPRALGCKLRPGVECSPSVGQCCHSNCSLVLKSSHKSCREETECSEQVFCSGQSARCQTPVNKPDGTECNDKNKVCNRGHCSESICSKFEMKECFLLANQTQDKRKQCELACQIGNDPSTCKGSSELIFSATNLSMTIMHTPGSPCNNYQGYCDELRKCRPIVADGPIVRAILRGSRAIVQWVPKNWWAVMLACLALMILTVIFIKCCAVHTPSSNPNRSPALRFKETLRDPYGAIQRYKSLKCKEQPSEQPIPLSQNIPVFPNDNLPLTNYGNSIQQTEYKNKEDRNTLARV